MLYVVVFGSRDYRPLYAVRDRIELLRADTTVVHGDARGVDKHAGKVAEMRGLQVHAMPADWDTLGKRAGHVRNEAMLEYLAWREKLGHEIGAVGFHDGRSNGTASMISRTKLRRFPLEVFDAEGQQITADEALERWRSAPDWERPYRRNR